MDEEKIIRTIYDIWLNNESRYLRFSDLRAKAGNELNELSDQQLRELINTNLNTPEFYNLRASKNQISCPIEDYKRLCIDQGRIGLTCGMPSNMTNIDESELLDYLDSIKTLPLRDNEYHVFGSKSINMIYKGCGVGGFSSILYPVQVGEDKYYLINRKPVEEAQLDFSNLPLIDREQLGSLKEVARQPWDGFGFYNESLDNEAEFNEFKKKNPKMNKNFNNKKYGKYFDINGQIIPDLKGEYFELLKSEGSPMNENKLKESDNTVTVGIYGDEVPGLGKVSSIVNYFKNKGIEVSDVSGDTDYGWEMNLTGDPRKLFFAVVNTIPGYNSDSVSEFIDEYRIDESLKEDLDNVESTDNTVVIDQPMGAAEKESKNLWQRFIDATKEPEDAPLFGAKEQPKPDEVEEPKAELKESKLALDEGLFEDINGFKTDVYNVLTELENDGWTVLDKTYANRGKRKFFILRKVQKNDDNSIRKAIWKAVDEDTAEVLDITYKQALGEEPIDDSPVNQLGKMVGKKILPKIGESKKSTNKRNLKEDYDSEDLVQEAVGYLEEASEILSRIEIGKYDTAELVEDMRYLAYNFDRIAEELYELHESIKEGKLATYKDEDDAKHEIHKIADNKYQNLYGVKNYGKYGDVATQGSATFSNRKDALNAMRKHRPSAVKEESLSEASTLPTGGKDEKFDTDAWSVIYWELSNESEGSADRKMARRAKVNAPMDSRYEHVDPVNDFDLRVYASDESGFDLAKKIADAWGVKYKIENTNGVHARKFPEEKLQMTLLIPEEMIG